MEAPIYHEHMPLIEVEDYLCDECSEPATVFCWEKCVAFCPRHGCEVQ
jgi:hypothetical protein